MDKTMGEKSVDDLTRNLGKLAVDTERQSFDYLVKTWLTTEEREYTHMRQLQELNAELTLGKQPQSEEDWRGVLKNLYGQPALDYLVRDKQATDAALADCLEETRSKPESCKLYDWLDRSHAGILKYPPRVDWVDTVFTAMLHEQKLEAPVALGVGLKYAAVLARPKNRKGGYSVYCANLAADKAIYANNVTYESLKEALGKVGFNELMKQHSFGELCCYTRSSASFETAPDSGFVSGDHVVLCWPNHNTGSGFFSHIDISRMPTCFAGGDSRREFDVPVGSVSQLCLLYPYLAFATNTAYFGVIDFLRKAKNYAGVAAQLKALGGGGGSGNKTVDLVVTFDIESQMIHRVIPVPWGVVSNVSLYPRMTCPLDADIPVSEWKISWNVLNESQPEVHGHTFTQPFFITEEDAKSADGPKGATEVLYWNSPTQELAEEERGDGAMYSSPCIEPCGAIFHYPGGHVVQISEHNMSTFVAKNEPLFPVDKKYHARHFAVLDCVIHGDLHITATPDGRVQFAQLRVPGKADLAPQLSISEADLAKSCGRKPPAGVAPCKDTDLGGHYKAIWVSSSFRVAVQMNNGLLIFIRPRTLQELRGYFENSAKLEAEQVAMRTGKIIAQKQLSEAHAYGVEPLGAALARSEALKLKTAEISPSEKMEA